MLHVLAMFAALESRLLKRLGNETGGVVIEYGIVVAVIALGLAAVGTQLVDAVGIWFGDIAEAIGDLGP